MRRSKVQSSYPKSPHSYSMEEEDTPERYSVEEDIPDERYTRDDFVMQGLMDIIKSVNRREEQRNRLKRNKKQQITERDSDTDQSDDPERSLGIQERERHVKQNHQQHVQKVHEELSDINKKLQQENKRLKNWDLELQKRESSLDEIEKQLTTYAASLKETVEKETLKRCDELEKEYELKMQQQQEEIRKSRNSFKLIKKSNDTLKAKVAEDESKLKSNEGKQLSLQSRVSNLQRKIELLNQQITTQAIEYKNSTKEKVKPVSKNVKDQGLMNIPVIFYESFSLLLQWIADVHLKENVNSMLKSEHHLHAEHDVNIQLTNEQAIKMIIFMPNILRQASWMNEKLQLSFVQFLYWSMLHVNITHHSQRLAHTATYRRIGEEMFQANYPNQPKENSPKAFFRSLNYHIRILSSLVILQSINQIDILVQVFQSLNAELKNELSKELFIEYHGTEILLPLFKLTNKIHLGYSTDILMMLAVESPYMHQFLDELSTVEWIQAILTILKASSDDITLMENLSLILQRLSKVKSIKPIFDALNIKSNVSEMLRLPSCEGEYVQLNLRSILLNIESMRPPKEK